MIGMKTERINIAPKKHAQEREIRLNLEQAQAEKPMQVTVERIKPKPTPTVQPPAIKKAPETAMAAAMVDQYPWTTDTIAEELGMPVASFRAWKMKVEQAGKIVKPKVGSLFCIADPEVKMRLRFSDSYVEKLKALRGGVQKKKEANTSALQHAKLKILVPVFDDNIAKFLLKRFKDEKGIEEYLKDHLVSIVKPSLNKIEELKKKFEQEMAELMGSL